VNCVENVGAGLSTPAAEAAELAGVHLGVDELTTLEASREFALHRYDLQASQIERLARELPLPQLQVPTVAATTIGPAELGQIAGALDAGIGRLSPEMLGR